MVEATDDQAQEQDERLLAILEELLPLATRHRGDRDDDEPVHQVLTSASAAPVPETRAVCSIFDLAGRCVPPSAPADASSPQQLGLFDAAPAPCLPDPDEWPSEATTRTIQFAVKAGDRVRVAGLAYPGNRWTAEKAERERIRRAKQRPPRPTAAVAAWKVRSAQSARP